MSQHYYRIWHLFRHSQHHVETCPGVSCNISIAPLRQIAEDIAAEWAHTMTPVEWVEVVKMLQEWPR